LRSRPVSVDAIQEAFRDHANEPNGVCCHPDSRLAEREQGLTAASVVMELDSRTMWLAAGPPCEVPFERIDFSTFLSKPSPRRRATRVSV
jgi:isopenicillin-N N-acyltransferase-like protein